MLLYCSRKEIIKISKSNIRVNQMYAKWVYTKTYFKKKYLDRPIWITEGKSHQLGTKIRMCLLTNKENTTAKTGIEIKTLETNILSKLLINQPKNNITIYQVYFYNFLLQNLTWEVNANFLILKFIRWLSYWCKQIYKILNIVI